MEPTININNEEANISNNFIGGTNYVVDNKLFYGRGSKNDMSICRHIV